MKKRIISIGILYDISFVEDYAKAHDMEHINIPNIYALDDVYRTVLSEQYDYIYINLKQLDIPVIEDAVLMFTKLLESVNSSTEIIVGAIGFLPETPIIMKIRDAGITKFVFADILFEQKEQFKNCMDGNTEVIEKAIPKEISMHDKSEEKITVEARNYKTIAVTSKTPRMGTSTLAIQLVKFFKNACYIQMNNSNWVQSHAEWCDDEKIIHDEEIGKISYENIDMYYKPEHMNSILGAGYDYHVYDYGTTENVSFFEKDIKIGVAGTSPSEMDNTQELIDSYYDADIYYCFNFVPDTDKQDILDLMVNKVHKTFFISDCPDPFFLSPKNLETYENVFNTIKQQETESPVPVKKKKRLFVR